MNFLALRRQLEAGTLSERDRRIAELVVPGCCDLVTGRIPKLPKVPHSEVLVSVHGRYEGTLSSGIRDDIEAEVRGVLRSYGFADAIAIVRLKAES